MGGKVEVFISTFIGYCIIFLIWNKWSLTSKEIVEMIFVGTLSSLCLAFVMNPLKRSITRLTQKRVEKK